MCGVIGLQVWDSESIAVELTLKLVQRLQHRGQDGAGLTVFSSNHAFESVRGLGLVDVALKDWSTLPAASTTLGHTRYATTGTGGVAELQPFVKGAPRVAMAHNGQIVNTQELIKNFNLVVETDSDLDVLQQAFLKWREEKGFAEAVALILENFIGSYAVVGIEKEGELFAFRDPHGIRPLYMAQGPGGVAFASETCALNLFQAFFANQEVLIREIQPGEWVRVRNRKVESGFALKKPYSKRACMFERVYFASPQSEMNDTSVYRTRFQLGHVLAREIMQTLPALRRPQELFDYVVPIPDTSRAAAIAVAETLGVSYREFLVKNPYVSRTFILGRQDQRLKALENKLSLIGPEIRGRRILLVDDSVVRGNTSRLMAQRLREAGAQSVSIASTCPPIRFGCYYGIDFPDPKELVANQASSLEEIRDALKVDALYYITQEGLKNALGTPDLCMACLDGDYPSRNESFESFLSARRSQRKPGEAIVHV